MPTVNIMDVARYKLCQKKVHDVCACVVPQGTLVANKFRATSIWAKVFGGSNPCGVPYIPESMDNYYLTAEEFRDLYRMRRDLAQEVLKDCKVAQGQDVVVVAGTHGELDLISMDMLGRYYMAYNSQGRKVYALEYYNDLMDKAGYHVLGWQRVSYVPDGGDKYAAMFVPVDCRMEIPAGVVNAPGILHGFGDFLVAPLDGGRVDLSALTVVNGLVFRDTYNNRGWVDCIEPGKSSCRIAPGQNLAVRDTPKGWKVLRQEAKSWGLDVFVKCMDAFKGMFREDLVSHCMDCIQWLGRLKESFSGVSDLVLDSRHEVRPGVFDVSFGLVSESRKLRLQVNPRGMVFCLSRVGIPDKVFVVRNYGELESVLRQVLV